MKTNDSVLKKYEIIREPKTLAAIWKGKGFEKIANLDEEIRNLRKELGNQILEKHK